MPLEFERGELRLETEKGPSGGTCDNRPTFQRWVLNAEIIEPRRDG